MDSLNSYCIEHICKYLDLQGQINMATISPDFLNVLQPFWKKSYKIAKLCEIENVDNSDILLQSIKGTVNKLILSVDMWTNEDGLKEVLSQTNFPNVDTVKMDFRDTDEEENYDDMVLLVVDSCPNAIELHMDYNFTGKYICLLKKLERISLKYSIFLFEEEYAEEIFKNLSLKKVGLSISEEFVARNDMDSIVPNLVKCETIEELYFDSNFLEHPILDHLIVKLKQLRKVSFTGYFDRFDESAEGELCYERYYKLPIDELKGNICGLIEGVIVNGRWIKVDSSQEAFLRLISRLKNLKLLCFSDAMINLQFLRRLIRKLNKNPEIHIYCHNTPITRADLRSLSNYSNVKLSLSAYVYDRFERSDIDILLKI